MKLYNLIIISAFIYSLSIDKFPLDDEIIILTDSTYEKAIDQYEKIIIFFYAPWCGHCQAFEPHIQKAAAELKKENIYIAKIDSSTDKKAAQKYNVNGFPTLLFFISQEPFEFNGGRNEKELINWARKKAGRSIQIFNERDEIEKFIKDNEICLIYFGDNEKDIKIYDKSSKLIEDYPFGVVKIEKLIKRYTTKGTIVLFKHFDEKKNELKKINVESILEFVKQYALPKVMVFNDRTVQFIFQKKNPGIILYADKKSINWNRYGDLMYEVSEKINRKLVVVITDIKEGIAARLADYVGIKEKDIPLVSILDTRNDFKKYNMDEEITLENILKFIEKWEKNQLKRQLKSEDEPRINNGDVFVIVGKTFEKEVINNDKDVILLFYAPWCTHCKELSPKYENVAKRLKNKNPKLLVAKIDGSQNDIDNIFISGFPTIMFFPGNKKNKPPIEYKGKRTIEDIIRFIKNNSINKINDEEINDEINNEKKDDIREENIKKKKDNKDEKISDL